MSTTIAIAQVLIFPGLLFTAIAGLLTTWIDRKVTARVQMRVGPPVLQPFYDVVKLMVKETCVPEGTPLWLFLGAPLIGLAGVAVASTILWQAFFIPWSSYLAPEAGSAAGAAVGPLGDLFVLLYLLALPALAAILGAFASRNPLASLGGSREMKLFIAYELPFVLAVLVPVIKSGGIQLGGFLAEGSIAAGSWSGAIALLVAILCTQAKLTLVPFDTPEAETELTGGAYVEYSGPPLAVYKLTRAMMLFTMPVFLVALFGGGIPLHEGFGPAALGVLKIVVVLVVIILIRNTAPRVRTDQALRFFWGPLTWVAVVAVILAWRGW